ncbi:LytTR family transcriptional regulator DNA-binding domain-containing protein [Larkinella arboricola]|uniref:LytTR family transcriptional regulator DNA-binding domain-containing protein n=1 Tax=Larkinella arboricola TaxID=643671 RepID=UPI000DBA0572|nr:LytTR family DNA-binding domain-containing protein [Larkinella arboricola]
MNLRCLTQAGKHIVYDSLIKLETRLDPNQFVRIHRSHIVNLAQLQFDQPPGGTTTIRLRIPCQSSLLHSADQVEAVSRLNPTP